MTFFRSTHSIRAFFFEHDLHGLDKVDEIEPYRPISHIPRIHLHALVVGGVTPPADLPKSGNAGRNEVVVRDVVAVFYNFLLYDGARSNETHLAADDVEDLREFVEAGTAQEVSDACDTRVVLELKIPFPLFARRRVLREVLCETCLGVLDHRSKFIARERFPVTSDAAMRKGDRPRVVDIDGDRNRKHDGRNQGEPQDAAHEIKRPLDKAVKSAAQIIMRLEEDDLLADETDGGEPPHGDADEVRRDDNARDERLDAIDEAYLRVRVEPGRGDHDVAHARGANDALRIVKTAEDGVFRRECLADRMVVEESDDPIVKPRVELKRADDSFRRPSRPDKEHRHTEESERVDAFPTDITPRPKE